jgi:23S rRNA (pseudouridine1915-N3)-methyltransferase
MKITLIVIGKTISDYLKAGEDEFLGRLKFYTTVDYQIISGIKNTKSLTVEQQKEEEGKLLLAKIKPFDFCVLLDEKGTSYTSEGFSEFIQHKIMSGIKNMAVVIGGAYGFSDGVYKRADHLLSLSKMTFSHQMSRLIFIEQLYRAFTILKGEPYHHK